LQSSKPKFEVNHVIGSIEEQSQKKPFFMIQLRSGSIERDKNLKHGETMMESGNQVPGSIEK
jgi:hypothetical protein